MIFVNYIITLARPATPRPSFIRAGAHTLKNVAREFLPDILHPSRRASSGTGSSLAPTGVNSEEAVSVQSVKTTSNEFLPSWESQKCKGFWNARCKR